jgi:hypothetical protein
VYAQGLLKADQNRMMSFLVPTFSVLGNHGLVYLLPASLRALEHLAAGEQYLAGNVCLQTYM